MKEQKYNVSIKDENIIESKKVKNLW